MNPSTAFGTVVVDELVRCGMREPGARTASRTPHLTSSST